jgi:hypothetical protein
MLRKINIFSIRKSCIQRQYPHRRITVMTRSAKTSGRGQPWIHLQGICRLAEAAAAVGAKQKMKHASASTDLFPSILQILIL